MACILRIVFCSVTALSAQCYCPPLPAAVTAAARYPTTVRHCPAAPRRSPTVPPPHPAVVLLYSPVPTLPRRTCCPLALPRHSLSLPRRSRCCPTPFRRCPVASRRCYVACRRCTLSRCPPATHDTVHCATPSPALFCIPRYSGQSLHLTRISMIPGSQLVSISLEPYP
ncbi:hypothetical protein B0H14DRAFT_3487675 [Mycena olivaceomarginata]|nr:hypothetical protein B0H14DRAFT_3487675 [Mycena olivaceomarginata]